jgi:NADPH:quinone reductase
MRPVLFGYVGTRAELEKNSEELFGMISEGKLKVAIHKVYPLSEVAQAHADLEGRKTTGKLVIKCN